jgi:flagellar hook assembly protein FlgD
MKNERMPVGYNFNKTIQVLLFLLLCGNQLFAQTYTIDIQWLPNRSFLENGELLTVPAIKDNDYANGVPYFSWQQKVKKGNYQLSFSQVITESAQAVDVQLLSKRGITAPNTPTIELVVSKARDERFIIASVFPYIMENGSLKRIVGFNVDASLLSMESNSQEKDYVANSVLNNGDWYKISVREDGIYKIDRTFLKNCGIDVDNLNPQQINIYGNASGRLSELNNAAFFDDLTKNTIQVVGESDGVFDAADYILFYGAGPNRWDYSSGNGFERNQHIYSDVNCYFIHISATDLPLRIQTISESSNTVTDFVNSYNYNEIHELENNSLVSGGQRWYGELFDGELTQEVLFNVPEIFIGAPVVIQYAVASNATSGGNSFRFSLNGNLLQSQNLSSGGGDYGRNEGSFSFAATNPSIPFSVTLNRINPSVKGYLDYIELTTRRNLTMMGNQFQFRDVVSAAPGKTSEFTVSSFQTTSFVWEITNKRNPALVSGTYSNNQFVFRLDTDTIREFIAFSNTGFLTPSFVETVPNQDLHALSQVDYLIVTHPNFVAQAQRLANLHEQEGTTTHVVTTEQIYNEYSSGVVDATAIRRFVKMFYDRANGDPLLQPKHLLLFGDGTFDPKGRVGNNNYMVPTYQVLNSENHINAMVTDDYFGLLDDSESILGSDAMDIGVGRLLITTQQHAVEQVNKIEHYMHNGSTIYSQGANECCTGSDNSTFGDWRLNYSIITDDEEGGYFINTDAEPLIDDVQALYPEMNYDKIYSDAYIQTSTAGGLRYPEVFDAITDRVERGSLLINYIGHGGEVGAAEERIITIPQIQSWTNIDKMPLFVTATCEFTKYDDPSRVSAGEWVSLNPNGGAIALMTTTRSVFFGVNSTTVRRLYENAFDRDSNFDPLTFGEIMRRTKNTSGSSDNRRSFTLIGDPALKIALPKWRIVTDSINHKDPTISIDTVRALSKMNVKGHIEDFNGNVLSSFNGVLSPTIYDKEKLNQTLQNDPTSPLVNFYTQKNALYKGKASVVNGYFTFDCIVPKDIDYDFGFGKISYYGKGSPETDADGYDTNLVVGGIDTNAVADVQGPEINLFLNNDQFVSGGISSQDPLLVVDCFDENGINTVGNGVGHDLIAILDGNTADPIVLNNYYAGKLDSYQSGQIQYTLKGLSVGKHTLEVKIWDVNNNSSVASIEFTVVADESVQLDHVLNYPNPFTTKTTFFFEHNQSCSSLETQIRIYTVSGRLVKTINKQVATTGFRAEGIDWDGTDDFGDQLAKGVYVYRLSVELPDGGKAEKLEKLVLLK